jgi:site-specific DNA recombinase
VFLNHAFGETPEERMLLQIQGVFAEYERALIKERSRRGRLFAARQGRVNWSHAPYGYRLIRKTENTPQKLVVDETEAEVVRQIFRWCVEDVLSCYAMEKLLRERGVPTRKGRALGWYQSTVGDILRDTVYKGLGYYNRTKRVDAKKPVGGTGFKDLRPGNLRSHAERPKEEWIPVTVPAIVDPETWELAQEQLRKNRERAKRNNTKHHYLLRSLLVCGECGKRMIGWWTRNGGRYVCADRYPRHEPWACDGRSVMAREVEGPIWEYVKGLLSDPELLKARYEEGRGDPAVDDAEEREKERIGRKLKALDREVGRLIDAYQAEVIDLADLKERRERIEEHGRMLKRRLSEIREKRAERGQEVRLLRGLEQFSESVAGALGDPSFETKQLVLRLVVDRIVVEEARVVVHHVVPTGPVGLQTRHLHRHRVYERGRTTHSGKPHGAPVEVVRHATYIAGDGVDAVLASGALGHLRYPRVVAGEENLGLVGSLEDDLGVTLVRRHLLVDALRPQPGLGGLPLDDERVAAEEDVGVGLVDV